MNVHEDRNRWSEAKILFGHASGWLNVRSAQ